MDGISARLSNAEMVSWAWFYSNVTGGVKLFVHESDAAKAALILSPQPVPQVFQPSPWICPKCQADVDGLWSFCWSCGTSKNGEEDPDFHGWYRQAACDLLSGKTITNVIATIISVIYLAMFMLFNASLVVICAWLITLMLWVLISRLLSMHKMTMVDVSDLGLEFEHFSDTHYDPSRDEFNPADDIAYKLWKAVIFSFGRWPFIYFLFALWLWFKTQQNVSVLSAKGLKYYFYSLLLLILIVVMNCWMYLLLFMVSRY